MVFDKYFLTSSLSFAKWCQISFWTIHKNCFLSKREGCRVILIADLKRAWPVEVFGVPFHMVKKLKQSKWQYLGSFSNSDGRFEKSLIKESSFELPLKKRVKKNLDITKMCLGTCYTEKSPMLARENFVRRRNNVCWPVLSLQLVLLLYLCPFHSCISCHCRNNYLDVSIFYEFLVYEYYEQVPSFTLGNFLGEGQHTEKGTTCSSHTQKEKFWSGVQHFWHEQTFLCVFSANVGGQLGLWLGASLLTVLECIDFVFHGVLALLRPNEVKPSKTTPQHVNKDSLNYQSHF